jgi:hypothetical protein
MTRSGWVLLGFVMALAAGACSVALAAVAGGIGGWTFSPNRQDVGWTTRTTTMTTEHFQRIDPTMYAASHGPATITFNGVFSGGPIALRIVNARGHVLRPGAVTFDPAGHRRGFSFTFVVAHGTSNCTAYTPQWRSLTGAQVQLVSADAVVIYRRPASNTKPCDARSG